MNYLKIIRRLLLWNLEIKSKKNEKNKDKENIKAKNFKIYHCVFDFSFFLFSI